MHVKLAGMFVASSVKVKENSPFITYRTKIYAYLKVITLKILSFQNFKSAFLSISDR